ncbi:MAG TPA: orotidine-5'-phosphate decarboxylase [Eubacteriaceae bacterium]|nr:orotidine-5'-phosphate decarboxylase [Eubacteriaceae bacterium]
MIMDRLHEEVKRRGPVCVGLDTDYGYLPEHIKGQDASAAEKLVTFNKRVIEATKEYAACFKVQIAYYEALGVEGMKAYKETLKAIRKAGKISIGDIKRGDISATAKMYAKGHFEGDFEADMITVNGYMGEDAVSPYYEYLEEKDKGLFVLLRTSNKSAVDFQDLQNGGRTNYEQMGHLIEKWGSRFVGQSGYSSIGSVVGLTYPQELEEMQKKFPNMFFLVPGYGAQGGRGKDFAKVFQQSLCGVVNSSRGIITAHQKKGADRDFEQEIAGAAKEMKEDIVQWLK